MTRLKPSGRPHLFVPDPAIPPDMDGRGACASCHLVGAPNDAHHTLPAGVEDVQQRAAGERSERG